MAIPDPAATEQSILQQADAFRDAYKRVREQIGKMVVGHGDIVDGVLICLFTGGNALLEGVPGLGKTLLIRSLSQALSLNFSRIQFTPDLMPADITGTTIAVEQQMDDGSKSRVFQFRKGPIFAQIVLADEINRATPKTQSAMLEAMQERSGHRRQGRPTRWMKPFFVMATQNPIEQEGTYPLPEAQLDRFMLKLEVGYSSRDDLHEIVNRTTKATHPEIEPVLDAEKIVGYQQVIRQVIIAPHVQDFAIRAVLATHPDGEFAGSLARQFLRFGGSPRACQALVLGGKVKALLDGRAHVSVEDIKSVMLPALRHRVLMNFEGQAEGITPDMVINDIIDKLPVEAAGLNA